MHTQTVTLPPDINSGINLAITNAVTAIRNYRVIGWTREAAIAKVREASTLGAASWARVLAAV